LRSVYAIKKNKVPINRAFYHYSKLKLSNLVTLYSVTSPGDDFAESFASYVHSEILKKPWKIVIQKKNQTIEFQLCFHEKRCQEKTDFLKKLLSSKL